MENKTIQFAEAQARLCSVFTHPRRILIFWTLLDQELSVGEIATAIEASLQNTSQHLHIMKQHGLLSSRREGQTIYYRSSAPELFHRPFFVRED